MLTLILLVVLCGGVGILAVSMAERKPATNGNRSRRASTPVIDAPRRPKRVTIAAPEPEVVSVEEPKPQPVRRHVPDQPRRAVRGSVPSSQTAVEGRLGDLVRPSFARRVFSLVGIGAIVVVVGFGIAALLGAIVAGAAEILGNTIG